VHRIYRAFVKGVEPERTNQSHKWVNFPVKKQSKAKRKHREQCDVNINWKTKVWK